MGFQKFGAPQPYSEILGYIGACLQYVGSLGIPKIRGPFMGWNVPHDFLRYGFACAAAERIRFRSLTV